MVLEALQFLFGGTRVGEKAGDIQDILTGEERAGVPNQALISVGDACLVGFLVYNTPKFAEMATNAVVAMYKEGVPGSSSVVG